MKRVDVKNDIIIKGFKVTTLMNLMLYAGGMTIISLLLTSIVGIPALISAIAHAIVLPIVTYEIGKIKEVDKK